MEACDLECLVSQELAVIGSIRPGQCFSSINFNADALKKNIVAVKFSERSELVHNYNLVSSAVLP